MAADALERVAAAARADALEAARMFNTLRPLPARDLGRGLRAVARESGATLLTGPGQIEIGLAAQAATRHLHDLADALDPPGAL